MELPGPLLASGRAADVYDLGDGTVLRRYRSTHDVEREARVMRWLHAEGLPVPEVHEAEGDDIRMDLVEGPTLIGLIEAKPWELVRVARLLAQLQHQVNRLEAPDWFPTDAGAPVGSSVAHLDLHPMNVMMGANGPVIIDWTNAARTAPGFDAATSVVLMSTFEVEKRWERLGQRLMVGLFSRTSGREAIAEQLPAACDRRLTDPNITAGEREAVRKLRRDS